MLKRLLFAAVAGWLAWAGPGMGPPALAQASADQLNKLSLESLTAGGAGGGSYRPFPHRSYARHASTRYARHSATRHSYARHAPAHRSYARGSALGRYGGGRHAYASHPPAPRPRAGQAHGYGYAPLSERKDRSHR